MLAVHSKIFPLIYSRVSLHRFRSSRSQLQFFFFLLKSPPKSEKNRIGQDQLYPIVNPGPDSLSSCRGLVHLIPRLLEIFYFCYYNFFTSICSLCPFCNSYFGVRRLQDEVRNSYQPIYELNYFVLFISVICKKVWREILLLKP